MPLSNSWPFTTESEIHHREWSAGPARLVEFGTATSWSEDTHSISGNLLCAQMLRLFFLRHRSSNVRCALDVFLFASRNCNGSAGSVWQLFPWSMNKLKASRWLMVSMMLVTCGCLFKAARHWSGTMESKHFATGWNNTPRQATQSVGRNAFSMQRKSCSEPSPMRCMSHSKSGKWSCTAIETGPWLCACCA